MTAFKNIDWRIIEKPGFESWSFSGDIVDITTLQVWLRSNLEQYEGNASESVLKNFYTVYIRFFNAKDAALFKLTWC